jgi:hypothetical protein
MSHSGAPVRQTGKNESSDFLVAPLLEIPHLTPKTSWKETEHPFNHADKIREGPKSENSEK